MGMDAKKLLANGTGKENSVETYLKANYTEIFGTLFTDKGIDLSRWTCTAVPKFTERNLTVNFAEAVKKRYPGAVCWYEFSFKKEKDAKNGKGGESSGKKAANGHFDAVIVSPGEEPFVIICEAKRDFRGKTIKKIKKDIRRIQKHGRDVGKAVSNGGKYSYFGAIILDGWADDRKDIVRLRDTTRTMYRTDWESNSLGKELFPDVLPDAKDENSERYGEIHVTFRKEEQKNFIHTQNDEITIPSEEEQMDAKNETIQEQYTIKVMVWSI